MSLKQLDLPSPIQLRAGWALNAAMYAARGWEDNIFADRDMWHYHDGGGNWAAIRKIADNKLVLFGMDHEYSETYFRESATYFNEDETNLLLDAPDWWDSDLSPPRFEPWYGFIYGWNGKIWQRANYDKPDGFKHVGLINQCYENIHENVIDLSSLKPGYDSRETKVIIDKALDANANFNYEILDPLLNGMDIDAAVLAGQKFLEMRLQ